LHGALLYIALRCQVAGGYIGAQFGWRSAFLACGLPGLAMAAAAWCLTDPPRGALDEVTTSATATLSWPSALRSLSNNKTYVVSVAGYAAVVFASGALAEWLPTFLKRHRDFDLGAADMLVGGTSAVGGLVGTLAGGLAADRIARWTRQPYLAISAFSMLVAMGFTVLALVVRRSKATST
jgi:predicted MFS family arabinose efflux permease